MRTIQLIAALFACLALASCGGIDGDERLADLGKEDRDQLCAENTWESQTCDDGTRIEGWDEERLCAELDRIAGKNGCNVIVSDLEAIADDPCSIEAQRAFQIFVSSCIL